MNAAKKIRRFIEEGHDPEQVQVLKDLAAALEMGRAFDLGSLYQIDMRYFDVALDLLKDWRFDHHIAARSKLLEQLLTEIAPDLRVDNTAEPTNLIEQPATSSLVEENTAPPTVELATAEADNTQESDTAASKPVRRRRSSNNA